MALNRTERNFMLLSIAASRGAGTEFQDVNERNCIICGPCNGTGLRPGASIHDLSCHNCKGKGYLLKINGVLFNVGKTGKGILSKPVKSVSTSVSGGRSKCRVK